jgi:hypothetical protein
MSIKRQILTLVVRGCPSKDGPYDRVFRADVPHIESFLGKTFVDDKGREHELPGLHEPTHEGESKEVAYRARLFTRQVSIPRMFDGKTHQVNRGGDRVGMSQSEMMHEFMRGMESALKKGKDAAARAAMDYLRLAEKPAGRMTMTLVYGLIFRVRARKGAWMWIDDYHVSDLRLDNGRKNITETLVSEWPMAEEITEGSATLGAVEHVALTKDERADMFIVPTRDFTGVAEESRSALEELTGIMAERARMRWEIGNLLELVQSQSHLFPDLKEA